MNTVTEFLDAIESFNGDYQDVYPHRNLLNNSPHFSEALDKADLLEEADVERLHKLANQVIEADARANATRTEFLNRFQVETRRTLDLNADELQTLRGNEGYMGKLVSYYLGTSMVTTMDLILEAHSILFPLNYKVEFDSFLNECVESDDVTSETFIAINSSSEYLVRNEWFCSLLLAHKEEATTDTFNMLVNAAVELVQLPERLRSKFRLI